MAKERTTIILGVNMFGVKKLKLFVKLENRTFLLFLDKCTTYNYNIELSFIIYTK